jgi:hypothetical protein
MMSSQKLWALGYWEYTMDDRISSVLSCFYLLLAWANAAKAEWIDREITASANI